MSVVGCQSKKEGSGELRLNRDSAKSLEESLLGTVGEVMGHSGDGASTTAGHWAPDRI